MGLNIGQDIYGNKTEELILNLILTPFLCHSSGITILESIYKGTRRRGSFTSSFRHMGSFSFRHHSNVVRMGHHSGKDIYGNKTEELILNLILTPFLCHSYGIQFRKGYI